MSLTTPKKVISLKFRSFHTSRVLAEKWLHWCEYFIYTLVYVPSNAANNILMEIDYNL